jgi:peptidoglycan/LPS O-acetylase OafA/YrhL
LDNRRKYKHAAHDPGFDIGWFSTYRDALFGFAIIAIVIWHFVENYTQATEWGYVHETGLKPLLISIYGRYIGSIGVEIFIFLSGMGLWYSFSKNSSLKDFYSKRLKRIAAPYIIVALLYWSIKDIYFRHAPSLFVKDITFVTFFTRGTTAIWFIGFITLMYIIFPLLYKIIYSGKHKGVRVFVLIALCAALTETIFYKMPDFYSNIEIALTRVPVFIAGIAAAPVIKRAEKIRYKDAFAYIFLAAAVDYSAIYLLPSSNSLFYRYADGAYSIALMMVFIMIWRVIGRVHIIDSAFRLAGKYSLEIYLLHVTMRGLMPFFGIPRYRISTFFTMVFVALMMAPGLKNFSDALTSLFSVRKKRGRERAA